MDAPIEVRCGPIAAAAAPAAAAAAVPAWAACEGVVQRVSDVAFKEHVEDEHGWGHGGAPLGNKNALGSGPPLGSKNALGNRGGGAPLGNKNALGNSGGGGVGNQSAKGVAKGTGTSRSAVHRRKRKAEAAAATMKGQTALPFATKQKQ